MKPYQRVTCIGYNTGKVIIGLRHESKPIRMTINEERFQRALLARPGSRPSLLKKMLHGLRRAIL